MGTGLETRIAAWFWGKRVESEIGAYAKQVLDMVGDLNLVVIDPEDREQVERLARDIEARHDFGDNVIATSDIQDALRSLLTPPKPDEPQGLGAVVEASAYENEPDVFVRAAVPTPGSPWVNSGGMWHEWSELDDVKVLSEGVA